MTLTELTKELQADKLYTSWSGVFFDTEHRLIRADKTFLNVVLFMEGAWIFRRLAPLLRSGNEQVGRPEPYILYTMTNTYRVQNGERRGKVVLGEELGADEQYRETGLLKQLREGTARDCLCSRCRADADVLQQLESLSPDVRSLPPLTTAPLFYTTCNGLAETPYARRNRDTLEFLRGFRGYNPKLQTEQNIRQLQKELTVNAGKDRVGYPFSFFYGKGVLAADVINMEYPAGNWYQTTEAEFSGSLPHLEIAV